MRDEGADLWVNHVSYVYKLLNAFIVVESGLSFRKPRDDEYESC